MPQICEITRKKIPHFSNLPEGEKPDPKAYRRRLLKRKIKVPEIKGTVSLRVTEEGLKKVNAAGGLAKYLKDTADNHLSPRLLRLKRKIHGEPAPASAEATAGQPAEGSKKADESAEASAKAEKPAEEPKPEATASTEASKEADESAEASKEADESAEASAKAEGKSE